ncbi:MAG: phosphate ABC transporter permease subunit PstC [Actinobacteria bacterium]|nr:phosphate ABC transporter permease subunit PstC [Actinomycetota bacterium]
MEKLLLLAAIISGSLVLVVIFFVIKEAIPIFVHNGVRFVTAGGWDQDISKAWASVEPMWRFGALPVIVGTFIATGGALILTFILGIGCSIFLAELAPDAIRSPVEAIIRLLAGIPSVVFGLIGLMIVVPLIMDWFISDELALKYIKIVPLDGQSLLAGILVLTFMILPFFITVAVDALRAVPKTYKEASLALGVNGWRTIVKVVIPVATPGIVAGIVLASGRAVGEAIALSMVAGAMAFMPDPSHGAVFFLEPIRTMASAIVDNKETMGAETVETALFAIGSLLLLVSVLLSLTARITFNRFQKRVMGMVE